MNDEELKTLEHSIPITEHTKAITPANVNDGNPINNHIQIEINAALALDLLKYPRFHRTKPTQKIVRNKRKQATSKEKLLLIIHVELVCQIT